MKTSPNGEITVINGPAVTPVLYHQAKVPALPTFERLTATTTVNAIKAMASPMTAAATTTTFTKDNNNDATNDDDDDDDDDSAEEQETVDNNIDKTKKTNETTANKSSDNKSK